MSRLQEFFLVGFIPFLFALLPAKGHAADPILTLVVDGKVTPFTMEELKSKVPSKTATIDDPVYGRKVEFEGFPLKDVLALGGVKEGTKGDEIVFTARDGYAPNMSFAALRDHSGLLAYQEKGNPNRFDLVRQGKAMVSPAPFYLVWEEGKKVEKSLPWPYQLVRIEVVDFKKKYPKLYPSRTRPGTSVYRGFQTFKTECMRCHSINLEGGDLGPELNAPKNVTEYWSEKNLRDFIQDPSSFRYRSKMPSFPNLKGPAMNELLDYLRAMKRQKVKL